METIICGLDTTPPVITILGDNPATVECGTTYTDAGATAVDDRDGDITDLIVVTNNVNSSVPGDYTVAYDVCDAAGNCAHEERVVHVVDTTPPVITLIGSATVTVECGTSYTDDGATAADQCDGNLTGSIVTGGAVNTAVPDVYTLTYDVTDSTGNAAVQVTRTVTVADTTPPIITLIGLGTVTVECGASYTDDGATADDLCAGNLTGALQVVSTVNTLNPGGYTVTFNVSDPSGNAAVPVVRTVNVVDTTPPVVTINGASVVSVNIGEAYVDLGATATDTCDPVVPVVVDNPVNVNVVGLYTVTYTATDDSGNIGQATRAVVVIDNVPPVITVLGNDPATAECGSLYVDAGATAMDNVDGDITANIVTTNPVNTAVPGVYTVSYNVTDAAGNIAETKTRTVNVVDTTAPVITLVGSATVSVECGGIYADAGATAADTCDGDLTAGIVKGGVVNTAVPGAYTITYNVTDAAGNAAVTVERIVTVSDTLKPVITLVGSATIEVECNGSFVDPGAAATDVCDGDLGAQIVVGGDAVNTAIVGDYLITYDVSDSTGNAANTVTRTVSVVDNAAPVITVLGDDPQNIACGTPYVEQGATATDTCDSNPVLTNDAAAAVDTNVAGTYTVTYIATDASGNTGTATREVIVTCVEVECTLASVEILSPIDGQSIVVPAGANTNVFLSARVAFESLAAVCRLYTVQMVYRIGGVPVGVSYDRTTNFGVQVNLGVGHYTLVAEATVLETLQTMEDTIEFNVRQGQDSDNNGLLDNPFTDLTQDGDQWNSVVPGVNCPRAVAMLTWFGNFNSTAPVQVTLVRSDDPTQAVTVSVPRNVLASDEQGVLIVMIACDLPSLLGVDEASKLAAEPENKIAGGVPFEVSVIVTSDGGAHFWDWITASWPRIRSRSR